MRWPYSLGLNPLADKVGMTAPKTLAVVLELDLQSDEEFFKPIRIGRQPHKRYSQKAIGRIREALGGDGSGRCLWERHRPRRRRG
jgi:hypothetical protein